MYKGFKILFNVHIQAAATGNLVPLCAKFIDLFCQSGYFACRSVFMKGSFGY